VKVQVEREQDGRWIAEVPVISGAMAYGATRDEAVAKVEALVLRILADRLEHGEAAPPAFSTAPPARMNESDEGSGKESSTIKPMQRG